MKGNLRQLLFATTASVVLIVPLSSCSFSDQGRESQRSELAQTQAPAPNESAPTSLLSRYIHFGSYQTNKDLYEDSKVVLFFYADWCSTCEEARTNFEASKESIPSDLVVVVIDFDNSDELRKKYGVTVQHTFVQIDSEGVPLTKWSGSVTIDQILENTL